MDLQVASFVLNLLLLPLLAVLWDVRIKITRLETTVCFQGKELTTQGARVTALEERVNRHVEARGQE